MKYLSVCSGVEAATVAWHDLGWEPVAFSEIEKFPSEVLAHHYPNVPNVGDMTKYKEWKLNDSIDLLVGGTPCQSFSVAGLRKGLEDPRGNLALTYVGILDKFRPKWCIWENVPGVLSSNGGRDFGAFLGALGELGYGWAYRVLDAQHFGVPQRRRRVFVVGCLGDWISPAKVLFESDCLRGNIKKSANKKQSSSKYVGRGIAEICATIGCELAKHTNNQMVNNATSFFIPDIKVYETHPADSRVKEMGDICQTVTSRWGTGGGNVPIALQDVSGRDKAQNGKGWSEEDTAYTVDTQGLQGVAYSLREDAKANNFSATELKVTPALQALRPSVQSHHAQTFVAYGFEPGIAKREGNPARFVEDKSPTLRAHMGDNQVATAYSIDTYNLKVAEGSTQTLRGFGHIDHVGGTMQNMAVRRLTPVECERLQGFPDDYTNIKEKTPDGPRYKAMGNSMAVPVMHWIGKRIAEVACE